MQIPSGEYLMLNVLKQMEGNGEYKRVEIFELLKPEFSLEEGLEIKLENNIGWAFTFLTRAEFIEKSLNKKASYFITELGKKALNEGLNGVAINEKYLRDNSPNYSRNVKFAKEKRENGGLETNLIIQLQSLTKELFTDFCLKLLGKMNYTVLEEKEVDRGVGVICLDAFGIKEKIYIQTKPYGEVSLQEIISFLKITETAKSKGLFISTTKFSNSIIELTKEKNVALIDDKRFIKLCAEYKNYLR